MQQPEFLILASNSPRRQSILKEARINFSVQTKETAEIYPPHLPPQKIPEYLARLKAAPFKEEISNEVVLTADTVVTIDDEVIGKPKTEAEAFQILTRLSGRKHTVITGVSLLSASKQETFSEHTDVYFKNLSKEEINFYIKNYKPFDKAGAYGIQEWIGYIGVEKINGSFYNVMGLPIHRVIQFLKVF